MYVADAMRIIIIFISFEGVIKCTHACPFALLHIFTQEDKDIYHEVN